MFFNNNKKKDLSDPIYVQPQELLIEEPDELLPEEAGSRQPDVFTPCEQTVIGRGLVFHGNFSGDDPIIINGRIEGDIDTSCKLTVSTGGSYHGNAKVANLDTDGTIEGNLVCDNFSLLGENSVMSGSLATKFMETRQGSTFSGNLSMTGTTAEKKPSEEPAPQAFEPDALLEAEEVDEVEEDR
ncbi:MAG: polymer-forming cytoskeletal protein [Firmicutes bacterium]|nr:polymer-forming cytoskeletal protein [Bacillota bacterium]